VLGVSFDAPEKNRAFAEKHGFPYRLLSDEDRTIGLAFGAAESAADGYARRYTFVIGPDGRVEQAIDTQDFAGQADALLATL
jgi:peroxiredoxin Q/BCP